MDHDGYAVVLCDANVRGIAGIEQCADATVQSIVDWHAGTNGGETMIAFWNSRAERDDLEVVTKTWLDERYNYRENAIETEPVKVYRK